MTRAEEITRWLITGEGELFSDLSDVEPPKGIYVCMNCGKVNNYFKSTCEACETNEEYKDV